MINNEIFLLIVSSSTHFVISTEKLLQNYNICCKIIPVPGEISAGCGLAIKTDINNQDEVFKIINKESLDVEVYIVERVGFKKNIKKIR